MRAIEWPQHRVKRKKKGEVGRRGTFESKRYTSNLIQWWSARDCGGSFKWQVLLSHAFSIELVFFLFSICSIGFLLSISQIAGLDLRLFYLLWVCVCTVITSSATRRSTLLNSKKDEEEEVVFIRFGLGERGDSNDTLDWYEFSTTQ